jgi:hypothetical protein
MKVDRVILSSNLNPMYYDFWNPVSKIYKEKFGITPTLIFFGTEEDSKNIGLSDEFGEIIYEKEILSIPNWQFTWALFYFTKFFENETCLIMGIDHIPLGTYFIRDVIEDITDDKYVMLVDNHYSFTKQQPIDWDLGGYCQSSYHIAKGKTFVDFYNFADSFEEEIIKVSKSNVKPMWGNGWGMDEAYSSKILYEYPNKKRIVGLKKAFEYSMRRIDCVRSNEVKYDINLMKNNFYIDCHSVRPLSNHKNYINEMINNIPYYV